MELHLCHLHRRCGGRGGSEEGLPDRRLCNFALKRSSRRRPPESPLLQLLALFSGDDTISALRLIILVLIAPRAAAAADCIRSSGTVIYDVRTDGEKA